MKWPVCLALAFVAAALGSDWPGARASPAATGRCHVADGRVLVPAGTVLLGEDGAGTPGRPTRVPAFLIDRHEVTNRQFAAFVRATGYRTDAEREGGGAIFIAPTEPVGTGDPRRWWWFVRGADWRHPTGPGSDWAGRADTPVVQVTLADALAYARWAGGALPSEIQWERAARGLQAGMRAPTSWAFGPDGHPAANVWTGSFPMHDTAEDGFHGIAPVGCFAPNDFGLVDMIGNVWEWTAGTRRQMGLIKGGSFLCAANYCANFRPAAFQAQERDLPTSHVGFRTVALAKQPG